MSTATQPSASLIRLRAPEKPSSRAKLLPPPGPRHLLRRSRLHAVLDLLCAEYPVTAIIAPAGSGKTVLAADWLQRHRGPTAWVTLDAADRDPVRLWASLMTGLEPVAPGATAGAGRRPPAVDDVPGMLAVLRPAARHAGPVLMVVDGVDRADDGERAGALLAAFVEHRPPWLRLLVLSRRHLPLPVERLRVSGALADLHFDALRLAPHEAASLLTTLCPGMQPPEIAAAVEHADGWAAAVQLTALARRAEVPIVSRADPASTSTLDKLVGDYLWTEVLAPARQDLVDLLVATSVVAHVSHGLAEALTRRSDAGELLEQAEAAGLFVTPVDREWFEVHRLVREVLVGRLGVRDPGALREQHARAAAWFESAGDGLVALGHWLRAERPSDALRVLTELTLPLLESGRAATVVDALARIPVDVATRDPEDAARYAWCHLAAGPAAFSDALTLVRASPATRGPARSRLQLLQAAADWVRGDWPGVLSRSADLLDADRQPATEDPLAGFGRRIAGAAAALEEQWDDTAAVVAGRRVASLHDSADRGSFAASRALGHALAGRPLEALRLMHETDGAVGHRSVGAELALAHGVSERELDHRDQALRILEDLSGQSTYPHPVLQLVARLELVRLRMSTGDLTGAAAELETADRLGARVAGTAGAVLTTPGPATSPAALVARAAVELALATDDPATAARWAADVSDPFWRPICDARIALADGRDEEALHALHRAVPRCPRHEVVADLVTGRVLATQERAAAAEHVGRALRLAAGHGMLRTVAAEGAGLDGLIELSAWRVPDEWLDGLRRALVPAWAPRDARRPVEDLTDRERDVLRLLPSRLTLTEIASELYVSPNTLKFHLRAIYRKLGVVSRAGAVDSARQMLLLPRG